MLPNRYRRNMQHAWDRVLAIPSGELETPWGTVEYAEKGQGPPVLVSHGIMGGHHVGLGLSDSYIVRTSRDRTVPFGYFRLALPESASAAVHADVYALLLDRLCVERAAVLLAGSDFSDSVRASPPRPSHGLDLGHGQPAGPRLPAPISADRAPHSGSLWLGAVVLTVQCAHAADLRAPRSRKEVAAFVGSVLRQSTPVT